MTTSHIIRNPASSGGSNIRTPGFDVPYEVDCCYCPPVKSDCCEICLPQCLSVLLSPGIGSLIIYFDADTGVWSGAKEIGNCRWSAELTCECGDPYCETLDDCGWKMRIACGTSEGSQGEFTAWECADIALCSQYEGFELEFTFDPPPECSCYIGGAITAIVGLPPEDEDCCLKAGCICMGELREMGWPDLLVSITSNADVPCPDCLPLERTIYWNGPPAGEVGSGWWRDNAQGHSSIPPECDPYDGTLVIHLDCGIESSHCDPQCDVDLSGEHFTISIVCNANGTASTGCFVGRLAVISCNPLLLRGTKICCPPGVQGPNGGTLSGCCGYPDFIGQGPPGCIDIEVTLAP